MRFRLIIYFLSILLLSSCNKDGLEPDQIHFKGKVEDADDQSALAGAKLTISGASVTAEQGVKITETDNQGNFEFLIQKGAAYDLQIDHPLYLPFKGCLNYKESCEKIRKNELYNFNLDPAGFLRLNLINSSDSVRYIQVTGNPLIYIGEVTKDSTVYLRLRPEINYRIGWWVYINDYDVGIDVYEIPDTISFSVSKFDTISFDIEF